VRSEIVTEKATQKIIKATPAIANKNRRDKTTINRIAPGREKIVRPTTYHQGGKRKSTEESPKKTTDKNGHGQYHGKGGRRRRKASGL